MSIPFQSALIISLFISSPAFAQKLMRFNCQLLQNETHTEIETFTLQPKKSVHQFVTPDRKFFIDLKPGLVDAPPPPAPPEPANGTKAIAATSPTPPPKPKKIPGLKLTVAVYSDFTAHYNSTVGLIEKRDADFPDTDDDLDVVVTNEKAETPEFYEVKCSRLDNIKLPQILKQDKVVN